jgi:hypothetical protein
MPGLGRAGTAEVKFTVWVAFEKVKVTSGEIARRWFVEACFVAITPHSPF